MRILLAVGGEILIGQVVNTNAAWLGERLGRAGVSVVVEAGVSTGGSVLAAADPGVGQAGDDVSARPAGAAARPSVPDPSARSGAG